MSDSGAGEWLDLSASEAGNHAGQRVDQALAVLMPEHSRAYVRKLLDDGFVRIGDERPKPSRRLKAGEAIRIFLPAPEPLDVQAEDLPLDVLYEDADIVVINKRPGMVAHPSVDHSSGTLVNALLHHYGADLSGIGGVVRPGIVHRLDKDTSGCLVAAKNDAAHRGLIEQFMGREVEKIYLAITDGIPKPVSGTVEGQIGRDPRNRKFHALLKNGGRHSLTHYVTVENYGLVALVECVLKTGRTHQARVHLASVGAPVLCDGDYGRRETFTAADLHRTEQVFRYGAEREAFSGVPKPLLQRQALHAWKLAFRHPVSGAALVFEAQLLPDMLAILQPLRALREMM